MSEEIEELFEELKTYSSIYEKLGNATDHRSPDNTILSQSEIRLISFLVSDKIYSILNKEPIYHIIAPEWDQMKEDFIYHISTDVKDLIKMIENHSCRSPQRNY